MNHIMKNETTAEYVLPSPFKYGAPDLKKSYRKYFSRGLVIAVIVHLFGVSAYWSSVYLSRAEDDPQVQIRILRYSELGPPPSITNIQTTAPAIGVEPTDVRLLVGNPVPVPDTEVNLLETMEIQDPVIADPMVQTLFFSIDSSKEGIQPLDWYQLKIIDPHTDVKVSCQIDAQGRLTFSKEDVLMEGHTEAGMIIQGALRTWIFTPFKTGTIQYWFNLPSKGKKLIINVKGLNRGEGIPQDIPISNGQMYLIEGISLQEIGIQSFDGLTINSFFKK